MCGDDIVRHLQPDIIVCLPTHNNNLHLPYTSDERKEGDTRPTVHTSCRRFRFEGCSIIREACQTQGSTYVYYSTAGYIPARNTGRTSSASYLYRRLGGACNLLSQPIRVVKDTLSLDATFHRNPQPNRGLRTEWS